MNRVNFKKRFWFSLLALFLAGMVSEYGVMPFPLAIYVIMTLILSFINIIPYLLSSWLTSKYKHHSLTIFIFPCALVTLEYLKSFGGGGTWGSIAYSQFENQYLMQIISVGGIWCITFLIGWFASLLNYIYDNEFKRTFIQSSLLSFIVVFIFVLGFGYWRLNFYFHQENRTERLAGITANNIDLMNDMYQTYFGTRLDINSNELSMNSPELAELQKAFVKFIENPDDEKFTTFLPKLAGYHDNLLHLATKEAIAGAKLITFSEALFVVTKESENLLIQKCTRIAKEREVYMAVSLASLLKGKIQPGSKFMENKIVLINPSGKIETTFFKNKPVPVVEGSIQGDGKVPVIETSLGKIALSICYDADFPFLMRKAGLSNADIMILPSGDWKEISPYHARMAACRAIENGFSLFRMVSGANSIATDYLGNKIAERNFYDEGEKVLIAYLPASGIKTIYTSIGDIFAWVSVTGLFVMFVTIPNSSLFVTKMKWVSFCKAGHELENTMKLSNAHENN
jgi:apolipoprotein N-acyltransferase